MVLAKGIELYERSERIEKISISSVFREAAELQSAALLATYEDIFSGDNNNDNTDQFRASAARLVAAETVIDQIAHTILNETNLGMSRTYLHELAVECIQNSGVNLTDLDDQATHWWEHMLFNSTAGVTASKHIQKVSAVRNHHGRMEVFNPEVAEGVFSEESMMVVLATVRANIAGFRDMSDRFPKEDFVIGHVNELLGDVSEKISSAIRRRHNSAGFQAKGIQGLSELVDEIAIQIEPLLFNRIDAIPYAFSEWADSVTVSAARNTVGILNTDQARVVLRNTFTDPKSDNQFVTSLSHVFSGMDASRQWHSLTKEGRAAAATLCLFEYLPVEQKVKMMQSDPMLVKAWAYLDNTGSKDLRRALASWRDGAMIAYASSKSAEFTALESVGLLQKAEHIISSAIMPRLPSVTNVESGMRLGSLVIGFSLAGVILSACGGKPPDVSTAMPEKSPTPDLVSLVSTHPALHKMLTDYKISEQCSFPSADVLAPADYITTINSHLTTAEAAFLNVPQAVNLSDFSLICDQDTGYVYLENSSGSILIPTDSGFMEGAWVGDQLVVVTPTAMPSSAEGVTTNVSYINIPEYALLSGGSAEISPDEEFQQLNDAIALQGLNPDDYDIKVVAWPTSILNSDGSTDYRWGSVIVSKSNPNVFLWPRYDDGDLELSFRPDMRPESRPWHYEEISIPLSLGKDVQLIALFQTGDERQLFVVADMTNNANGQPKVVAYFDPDRGVFIDLQSNQELTGAPDWADGVDTIDGKEVFYKLGTDGKTHNYDTGFKTPEGEVIWASSHIKNPTFKGGIPSYDEPGFGLEPGMRIDFQVKEGINAPYIQHETNKNFKGGLTYSVNFLDTMASRHFAMPYGKIGPEKVGEFNRDIFLAGKLAEPVWDAQGNPHTIYGDTSFKIILVDPTDIPNPDWETSNRSGPATNILSMAIFNDETHTVTILVANTKPIEQLSDQEFVDTIFIPYGYALLLRYQSLEALKAHSDYYPNSDSLANLALKGDPPYITISESP